jgi:hypothetical protein
VDDLIIVIVVCSYLEEPCSKLVGRIALAPKTRKNGVNLMAPLGVVLRLQITEGSLLNHRLLNLFSSLKFLGLRPYRIMPLARSTCSFVLVWAMDDQSTRM